ncbi:MAG: pyruvate formate lyase family protein [Lentisphaeria bacterium]
MSYEALKKELREFYGNNGGQVCINTERLALTKQRRQSMEAYAVVHPEADSFELRRKIYELIKTDFQPIIFPDSPFYCEMGGNGGWNMSGIGRWLLNRNIPEIQMESPETWEIFNERCRQKYYLCCGPYFDISHNSPPIFNILKKGFKGIYGEACAALPKCTTKDETKFVETAIVGLETVHVLLRKYGEAAKKMLLEGRTAEQQMCLRRIAESAPVTPWLPPRTFYEALNTTWFVREIMGELDGLAINSLGRLDAWLIGFYDNDLKNGRITPDEAYDLICRFLLLGDMLYDHNKTVVKYGDHENEIVFTLGGCDPAGTEVFNDLTKMFLRAHREMNLIYPKPHCRFSTNSNHEYLLHIGNDILSGRCVYSLLNDDCIIPALVKDGKALADARDYCCTGCWDLVLDSREDNAGGNYFSLARIMEATIHDAPETLAAAHLDFQRIDTAENFEEVYRILMENTFKVMLDMLKTEGTFGQLWSKAAPAPLHSACSLDCLEKRKDFTAGGQRYNPHAFSLCFFANFIDSLLAISTLCFERKICTLPELLNTIRNNWKDAEVLHHQALNSPHWGDNKPETVSLARRVFEDIYARTRSLKNERGGCFQLGVWIYREFRYWGEIMKALPDGRRDGELLAQSLNPSHFRNREAVTTVFQCLSCLDLTKCAGNSVVNLVLDKSGTTPDTIEALLRTFAQLKLQLLQLNCTSHEELLDAQKHPEAHENLIVKICGFSAKFTALSKEWQEEVIHRRTYRG